MGHLSLTDRTIPTYGESCIRYTGGEMLMLRLSPLFLPFITLLLICLVQQIRRQRLVSQSSL